MDEEDDPVVQEIPLFLSQALAKNLHIFQFPIKPANRDWESAKVQNASIKPMNQMVRLEVGLDTYSDKYCPSKGEVIAHSTDGRQDLKIVKEKDSEKNLYFKSGTMDKIVYESNLTCSDSSRYAIAILQDKEIHCTPVNGIIQLRPSYSYFDKQDKRRRDLDKLDNSDEEEEEQEAQQVTVKFSRQETDNAKKMREKSFEFLSKKVAEEPWYDALWKHADSDSAELERLKLFSAESSEGTSLSLKSKDYIRALVPEPPVEELEIQVKTTIGEQIRDILKSAKMLTFNDLKRLVQMNDSSGPIADETILSALTSAGCCVRGNWTARSADLYTQATPPPKLMCAARDHVLYLLAKFPHIDRRKITAVARLPPKEVLEIIQSVAKLNPQTGWELIIPPDTAFEDKYPDVVQRQYLYLEGRQRVFNEMLADTPKRTRKKSQRDSISSDSVVSPKVRCNSVSEEEKRKKVSVKRTRNASSSSAQEA